MDGGEANKKMEEDEVNGEGRMSGEGKNEVAGITGDTSSEEDTVWYISPPYYDLTRNESDGELTDSSDETQNFESNPSAISV